MPLGYYGMSGSYILYFLLIMLIPLWAQFKVKRTYERYKKVRTKSGLTGKEVAEIIMQANGITGVRVVRGEVELSDHYDPTNNIVVLSPIVHDQPTVASVAIAAHEIGHVIQDKVADYKPMRWRHSLVPLANLGGNYSYYGRIFINRINWSIRLYCCLDWCRINAICSTIPSSNITS